MRKCKQCEYKAKTLRGLRIHQARQHDYIGTNKRREIPQRTKELLSSVGQTFKEYCIKKINKNLNQMTDDQLIKTLVFIQKTVDSNE